MEQSKSITGGFNGICNVGHGTQHNEDIVNTKGKIYKLPEKYRHNKLIIIIVTTQARVILYVQKSKSDR